jgi:hypothetical protein
MRQLSPATNLLLACLSALGLVAALGLPWYAPAAVIDPAVAAGQGSVEEFGARLARTFTSTGETWTGTEALGTGRTLLLLAAGAVVFLCLLMIVPFLRSAVRDVLRAAALVAPLTVVYLAFDTPGASHAQEIRWGLLVGVAASAFMATSAWHGSSIRVPRRAASSAAQSRAAA